MSQNHDVEGDVRRHKPRKMFPKRYEQVNSDEAKECSHDHWMRQTSVGKRINSMRREVSQS